MICDRPDLTLQAVLADQLRRVRRARMFISSGVLGTRPDQCSACWRPQTRQRRHTQFQHFTGAWISRSHARAALISEHRGRKASRAATQRSIWQSCRQLLVRPVLSRPPGSSTIPCHQSLRLDASQVDEAKAQSCIVGHDSDLFPQPGRNKIASGCPISPSFGCS